MGVLESPFDFFRSVDFLNSFNLQARVTLFQSNVGWKDCQCFQSLPTSTLVDISQIWKVRIDPTKSWRNSSSNCPSRQIATSATTFQFRHTTVREAALNTAVVAEVACWFFIGEFIGKGGLIGYDV